MNNVSVYLTEKRHQSGIAARLVLLLGMLVLFAQTVELTHVHDEFGYQADCHVCLKLGTSTNAVTSSMVSLNSATRLPGEFYYGVHVADWILHFVRSRGPPSFINQI